MTTDARVAQLEKQIQDLRSRLGKPRCLDCNWAGITNCSHFDNCDGTWKYQLEERAEAAEKQVEELQKLAYLGEHHFPDLTYKARLAESRREVEGLRAALREARGMMKILDRHAEYEAVTEFLNRTDALVTQLPTAPQKDKP